MNLEQIEYLHSIGKMSDRFYYMLNGKSPIYNLWEQRQKAYQDMLEREEKIKQKKTTKNEFNKQIEKILRKEIPKFFSKR